MACPRVRWPFSERPQLPLLLLLLQAVMLLLFVLLAEYGPEADPLAQPRRDTLFSWVVRQPQTGIELRQSPPITWSAEGWELLIGGGAFISLTLNSAKSLRWKYQCRKDVHIMIFVGFGFLMTFLKRYGLSSVSINFMLAAVLLQWAVLVNGFFHLKEGRIPIDIEGLLGADFTAACVLISFGVVLGKTTPTQLLIMAIVEVPIFVINEIIGRSYLQVSDMGDSIFVHAFGAYFGMAVSFVLFRKDTDSDRNGPSYTSDLFSMIGTVFLWCFWPSFNSALAAGDVQSRAVINTILSLTASCIISFATSALLDKRSRFSMEHVQNATLAGGVAIGTGADMLVHPYGALLVGSLAGAISVIGFSKVSPVLESHCRIHDTCGVHNLHGMPSLLAAVVGAIAAAMASVDQYGSSLYVIWPARAPANATEMLEAMSDASSESRTASTQGGMQMLAMVITIVIAIVTGLLTGLLLRLRIWQRLETEELYSDHRYFIVHDDPQPKTMEIDNGKEDTGM